MYRIRFHGRGGQGMKTASRILGTAFFLEGFEVQDAPRYGAERRGAPIFAYVRASRTRIHERGIIHRPGLVLVADDTLVQIPAAGVLSGATERTVLLIHTAKKPDTWENRLNFSGSVVVLPEPAEAERPTDGHRFAGIACTGAAARLVGVIPRDSLSRAIHNELKHRGQAVVRRNQEKALDAYDFMEPRAFRVTESEEPPAEPYESPDWVDLPFDDARLSAPVIHATATSVCVRTGLWRTMRPVVDYARCNRCWWICSTFCPDGTIRVDEQGYPRMDYDHCKGCMICVTQCTSHAIRAVPEEEAQPAATEGDRS